MLTIEVVLGEGYDEATNQFVPTNTITLDFEHSLVSLSKWESEFGKPFLSDDKMTPEETLAYVRLMCLTPGVSPDVFLNLSQVEFDKINDYVGRKMTATWFTDHEEKRGRNREVITAEIVYYWMVSLQIPFECQYWHFDRLIALIKVCNIKNQPKKKMTRREMVQHQRSLNAQRRAANGSRG